MEISFKSSGVSDIADAVSVSDEADDVSAVSEYQTQLMSHQQYIKQHCYKEDNTDSKNQLLKLTVP
jgi:hypothetical protein